ncbi:protein kinase [Aliifodinibius sp. S!AR15-10]|uniref:protein kinase domain-containing protein n=1 Tax=Aliifodinibius sp. S!AR15-10 TaxID=2950437 RepID=UPI002854E3B4|nr:protein kinase [Aliifodinibius sp. S!AR15-10]MDR8393720.1 protein kinase [Aliifodinibius sp. S!AR15-10]
MVGKTISHYNILEKLGGGGMGVVYKAEDLNLKRPVALKFLPQNLSRDEDANKRFTHEAQAASALDHNHLCTIYEIGETTDGRLFMAMAYYEGETLKKKVGTPFKVEDVVAIATQIAEGLSKAHQKDILHRDLKPANIMLTNDGIVKILDFGLAKLRGQTALTKKGTILGTAAYMSPEQARGEQVDQRSDIWSLGVVLYELLVGQLPFTGEYEQAVFYSILSEDPEPPTARRTGVPMELERIILKALAKDPGDRYQHVEEMLVDLNNLNKQLKANSSESGSPVFPDRKLTKPVVAGIMIVVLAIIIGMVVFPGIFSDPAGPGESNVQPETGTETFNPPLDQKSIAVLPFTYLGREDSADYFSLGMTDELLTRLAQIRNLAVIGRTSVMKYQDSDMTLPEIGRELGVAHLLEGSVQLVGNQVRIRAQLVDAGNGLNRWADSYTYPFKNILDLQSRIAGQVARELEVELLPGETDQLAASRQVDPTAYRLYLQGRHLRFQETGLSLTQAVRLLLGSIEVDSTFAPAWATLSTTAWLAPIAGGHLPHGLNADSLARAAGRRAVALDSTSAEAHVAMGLIHYSLNKDFRSGGPWLKRAILLNPGLANAHRDYGVYLSRMGRFEEAEPYLKKAVNLDPASPIIWQALGWNHLYRENYGQARRHFERALTLQSDFWLARAYMAEVFLAQGQPENALHETLSAVEVNPSPFSLAMLGRIYALTGQPDSARAVLRSLRNKFGPHPFPEAIIYTSLGEKKRALNLLEDIGGNVLIKVDPVWAPLRGEPRYRRLLERMGLDDASVRETMARLGEEDNSF